MNFLLSHQFFHCAEIFHHAPSFRLLFATTSSFPTTSIFLSHFIVVLSFTTTLDSSVALYRCAKFSHYTEFLRRALLLRHNSFLLIGFLHREGITIHYYVREINIYQHHGIFPKKNKECEKWQGREV
jgi:hypothetical protein